MSHDEMRKRTREIALRIIRLVVQLPSGRIGDVLGRQILRSGTSVGANYREALRASSRRHFISYIEIASREAEETYYWLDLLTAAEIVKPARLAGLQKECTELVAILTATGRTAKRRKQS